MRSFIGDAAKIPRMAGNSKAEFPGVKKLFRDRYWRGVFCGRDLWLVLWACFKATEIVPVLKVPRRACGQGGRGYAREGVGCGRVRVGGRAGRSVARQAGSEQTKRTNKRHKLIT